ncbi:C6 transcription factor protein [Rutstroemia sp. NJR-2017a BBW]|nr:C6 transcription factor protein [Rutstroemia sp. NJR-2017a BBW]
MATRRSHKKSRKGCITCKQKHLKCDEGRPECGNCLDRGNTCTYLWERKAASSSSRESSQQPPVTQSQVILSSPDTSLSPLNLPPAYNIGILKLLHHYSTNVYESMSTITSHQKVWQTSVVQIGMEHDFLLRGILSMSALHVALTGCENPQTLLAEAAFHQNRALVQYRQLLSAEHNPPEIQRAMFLFASFLSMCSFGLARLEGKLLEPDKGGRGIEDFLVCVNMVRGMTNLFALWQKNILSDDLDPIRKGGVPTDLYPDIDGDLDAELRALSELEALCKAEQSPKISSACQNAVAHLSYGFKGLHDIAAERGSESPIFVVLVWPSVVSKDFLRLLAQRNRLAVLLLAYYGAMMHRLDSFWYFQGWGRHLVETSACILGDAYADALTWPKVAVGLCDVNDWHSYVEISELSPEHY